MVTKYVCPVWWTKLDTRQLFTARYVHNIVSYRIVVIRVLSAHIQLNNEAIKSL